MIGIITLSPEKSHNLMIHFFFAIKSFFSITQSTGYNLLVKHAASSLGDAHMIVNVAVP
jgi:hypothetical protein